MQIFKTTLFKTNQIFKTNNKNNKGCDNFVTEPILNNEISNHYFPAFKSNIEIYEKMKKVSSKNLNIEELKKLFTSLGDKAKENFNLEPFGETKFTVDVVVSGKKYVVEADEFRRNAASTEYPGCKVFVWCSERPYRRMEEHPDIPRSYFCGVFHFYGFWAQFSYVACWLTAVRYIIHNWGRDAVGVCRSIRPAGV